MELRMYVKNEQRDKKRYISPTPAVEQAAEIIIYLASAPQIAVSMTGIAETIGIARSKTHSLLTALQRFGFVTRDAETKLYALGWGLIPVGQQALQNVNYGDVAKPFLEELAQKTKCTALFGLIKDEHVVITAVAQSGQPVESRLKVGRVLSLYEGVLGKVIAASLSEEEQENLLASKHFQDHWTPHFDYRRTKKKLDKIRGNKYISHAVAGQAKPIIKLLASAVIGVGSTPIGVLFVVGIITKSDIPRFGNKLAKTAEELSARWGHTAMIAKEKKFVRAR
jgi:DNA-binding IclR family transcriptional regulator